MRHGLRFPSHPLLEALEGASTCFCDAFRDAAVATRPGQPISSSAEIAAGGGPSRSATIRSGGP